MKCGVNREGGKLIKLNKLQMQVSNQQRNHNRTNLKILFLPLWHQLVQFHNQQLTRPIDCKNFLNNCLWKISDERIQRLEGVYLFYGFAISLYILLSWLIKTVIFLNINSLSKYLTAMSMYALAFHLIYSQQKAQSSTIGIGMKFNVH